MFNGRTSSVQNFFPRKNISRVIFSCKGFRPGISDADGVRTKARSRGHLTVRAVGLIGGGDWIRYNTVGVSASNVDPFVI